MLTETFKQAKEVVAHLVRQGHTAYFAGGWVRDYLMGHPSVDIDIATSATPAQIMDLFPQTLLVGLAFGIVIVLVEGHSFEVATFRKDLAYVDGRHPQGIELSTPQEDAYRRDFTINGMFYDPLEEKIHDYVQGQEDLKRHLIRTIGDPHARFLEDRLRLLRAFRFAARFAFAIAPETQEAIRENANQLFPAVAMERVWQEFNKMVTYPRFDQALIEMHHLTVLPVIFPELQHLPLKELKHLVKAYTYFPVSTPTLIYLMELFPHASLEQKMTIAQRLKVSVKELKNIEFLHQLTQAVQKEPFENAYPWVLLMAHPFYDLAIQIVAARLDPMEQAPFLERFQKQAQQLNSHVERLKKNRPLVTAALLQQKEVLPGKRMGLLLKEAERLAINHDLQEADCVLQKLMMTPLWKENK